MALARGVFIVAAKRTPFGAFGGKLKNHTTTDLAEIAAKAALASGKIDPKLIDSVIFGNVAPSSKDGSYLARHAGLRAGVNVETPCLTVNRLCGSGFQSIVNGCQDIVVGDAEIVLTGGSESMSMAPFVVRGVRFGTKLGQNYELEDQLWATLTDYHIKTPMGITAETLGAKYGVTREDCDKFALSSQQRWRAANDAGFFKEEMAPVTLKIKKKDVAMDTDEHPREVTLEALSKLPPVFKKDGLVSAGNASGICDGAGAVILASENAVTKHNLTPLARVVGYHVSGCDPNIMGIGPVPAVTNALKKNGLSLDDMDLVDVNEAFAAQFLAVQKELGLNPEKTNVNGGAVALGHPVGASGSRITAHLTHELRRRKGNYAIGSACIGGGQGIAVIIENIK
ncbi:3-ketoacyl-CoA thiolase, mitochondrial-like [Saccoglossus kowalevskii]|uniref:3-ketoacyl-CoA thiolase, mitochondrial-like n=1 Tax=Saccoglossus kowalevskii TaxID=10224 RepID=A0ABM0GMQ8_SACKO|nr:PREDICTED: 3-ketoacyl-CoA thiolase, mitochondrial-like [Saccoglossus kowalevskii]